MEATLTAREQAYMAACRDEEIELIRELCGIPAPSHQEEKRAEFCLEWLKRAGAKGAYDLKAHILTDEATEMRPDGNNVDADAESMKLYQNYVRQLYLYQKISGQFTNLRYVLNQAAK